MKNSSTFSADYAKQQNITNQQDDQQKLLPGTVAQAKLLKFFVAIASSTFLIAMLVS